MVQGQGKYNGGAALRRRDVVERGRSLNGTRTRRLPDIRESSIQFVEAS
jgi:hypothetical protein